MQQSGDHTLVSSDSDRLADLIELANLSAIVGNLFRRGIATVSNGTFKANRPHTFPDLLANAPGARDLEIKVALEANNPKGHLVKPGPHLTVRYVLADENGTFVRGTDSRGDVCVDLGSTRWRSGRGSFQLQQHRGVTPERLLSSMLEEWTP